MRSVPFRTALLISIVFSFVLPVRAQLEAKLDALDELLGSVYDGDPVSLDECIEVALVGNARLGGYEEAVETSELSRKKAALWNWLPDLSASARWSKSTRTDYDLPVFADSLGLVPFPIFDSQGNPFLIGGNEIPHVVASMPYQTGTSDLESEFSSKSGTISSSWTLFAGFARFAALRRTNANLDADRSTLDYQQMVTVQDVANRYVDLVKAMRKVEVAEEAEALALAQLERSETYFELGISTRSDVLQQKVNHQNTKLTTVRERNAMRNAFVLLAHAMGIPSSRPFEIEVLVPSEEEMEVPELAPLVQEAAANRLDLSASRRTVDSRDASVTEARSGYYPSVQMFASYTKSETESPQSLRFGSQLNDSFSWGFQGNWNIWDRFQTQEQTRQAVAAKRRAEYDLRMAALNVEAEVVAIHNNLNEAVERYQVATQTVEQAQEDLRLSEERFRVGAGTSLDVINAQVGLAQARRDVVDAQTDFMKYRQQLRRATGSDPR